VARTIDRPSVAGRSKGPVAAGHAVPTSWYSADMGTRNRRMEPTAALVHLLWVDGYEFTAGSADRAVRRGGIFLSSAAVNVVPRPAFPRLGEPALFELAITGAARRRRTPTDGDLT
jgi:hypothetical protein